MSLHADLWFWLLFSPTGRPEKKTGIGGTLKGVYANDLELSFQKNLSEKTRSLKIAV